MKLADLIEGMGALEINGNTNIEISGITFDSRKVEKGFLFVCIEGFKTDGHKYVDGAVEKGAVAVIANRKIDIVDKNVTYIYLADTRGALSFVSDKFYNHPSSEMSLIGVTGTKGKTTITYMIKSILEKNGEKVGVIGTVGNMIGDKMLPTERTTPESIDLQSLFREMLDNKVESCVMEVSSHALELKRVNYSKFKVGIFTNLSQDHLDFHGNFDNYLEAKSKLFSMCEYGIVNIDSEYGQKIIDKAKCKILTIGIEKEADIKAINVVKHRESVEFELRTTKYSGIVRLNIPGQFAVYNALCAIGASMIMDIPFESVLEGLWSTRVPGRAEIVKTPGDYTVMIDYAHSPDSLKNILSTVKEFAVGRVVSVFGCGGDRDRTKRPIMGKISGEIADFTIVTSDNPRTEVPGEIIKEIELGISETGKKYITIEDRRLAIKYAIMNAQKNDMIVIAGKGHETYQDFGCEKVDFDERVVVAEIIEELGC
jgi:UDP-N-acetylmuramoyl-L-alanyl-D-glutamate--2,6-diaminopimelate ligase